MTEQASPGTPSRRRAVALLLGIVVIPALAFAISAGVHAKYEGDLRTAVEAEIGRPLEPEERATVLVDTYCADPQAAGDDACRDLAIAAAMQVLAAASLVVGLLLLAFIVVAGRAAGGDRSALLRLFRPGLIVTLLGLVVLVIADGLLLIGVVYLGLGVFAGRIYPILILAIAIGALIAAVGIIRAVFRVSRRATSSVLGRRLDDTTQPALHAFVQELAAQLGAEPPEHIIAGLDPEFYVTEVDVDALDGACTGRTLYLSLPLSRILSLTELRAVLGHELGHFRGSDTRFSKDFYPIYRGAAESIGALAAGAGDSGARTLALLPAFLLMGRFMDAFAGAESALSRERELAADQAGAESASPVAIGSALVKLCAFSPLWAKTMDALIEAGRGSIELDNASRHFVSAIRAGAGPEALQALDTSRIAHPTDSHPPLSERLAALDVTLADVSATALDVDPGSPGVGLVAGPDELEAQLTDLVRGRIAQAIAASNARTRGR